MITKSKQTMILLLLVGFLAACRAVVQPPPAAVPVVVTATVVVPTAETEVALTQLPAPTATATATATPIPTATPVVEANPVTSGPGTVHVEKPAPSPLSEFGVTGPPPTDTCIAAHPGPGGGPVEVRLGPGTHFGVMGHLGLNRWAHVLHEENRWFQIVVGPGSTGWVDRNTVALNDRCAEAVIRIEFAPGTTASTIGGHLLAGERQRYLFRAQAGQGASITLGSAGDVAAFSLRGVDDERFHKTPNDPSRHWHGVLPQNQDYLLEVNAPQETGYELTLAIEPLPDAQAGSIGGVVYRDGNDSGTFDDGEEVVPGVQVLLIAHNCDGSGLLADTVSAAGGHYQFTELQPGGYCVATSGPDGYGEMHPITLAAGQALDSFHLGAPQDTPAP